MKNLIRWPFLIFLLIVAGCAPAEMGAPIRVATTYAPNHPVIDKEGPIEVVRGATQVSDMVTQFDAGKNGLTLHGQVTLRPIDNSSPISFEIDINGIAGPDGRATMTPSKNQPPLPNGIVVKVIATCLGQSLNGEGFSCDQHFVDIYIDFHSKKYHHQVGTPEKPMNLSPASGNPTSSASGSDAIPTGGSTNTGKVSGVEGGNIIVKPSAMEKIENTKYSNEVRPNKKDEEDEEEDDDQNQVDPEYQGRYLGDVQGDIEKLFDEKPGTPQTQDSKENSSGNAGSEPNGGKTTKDEKVVIYNQVVGEPSQGRLENASNLLEYEQRNRSEKGFHVIRPERQRHFGSVELISLIKDMGLYTLKMIPHYALHIGDLSQKKGGKVGRHVSHQSGLDVDIAFFSKNKGDKDNLVSVLSKITTGVPVESWMETEQWKLFKYAVKSNYVDRIFIHPVLKNAICQMAIKNGEIKQDDQQKNEATEALRRLRPEKNHYNHFHLRVRCSKAQIRCRQMADPPDGTGCF